MRAAFYRQRVLALSKCILLVTIAPLVLWSVVADDSVYGTYSGECTLNGEPVQVELEIVRNEMLGRKRSLRYLVAP
jgi:hypothetical protein